MRPIRFLGTALAAFLLSAAAASAFTVDDTTLNDKNGNSRFSDPDDQTPAPLFSVNGRSAGYGQSDDNNNSQSPGYSNTAAPFSPASGYAIPRH